jgi:hypothetical protein|tara:strand:- start:1383 stop:1823 length:441 start_codon:yes stop_codon:yes gene_type:complete
MSEVSKRFELLVKSVYKKFIDNGIHLPQRTPEGILVGNVLIKSNGPLKDLVVNGTIAYTEISLNCVAIKIANNLASDINQRLTTQLFEIDREYSKHFVDSKFLIDNYHRAVNNNNEEKAEILWTRYEIAKEKALDAKSRAEYLTGF